MFMEKIKNFVESWKNRGYEKGETQIFWLSFLRDVLKISEPEKIIQFEVPVKLKHKSFIDAFLPDTKIIIEQKSSSVNLSQEKNQSDGEFLTPFEQAQRYGVGLPVSMHPQKIIVCNFKEFLIYDMELMNEPTKIFLEELPEKFSAFDFMIDAKKSKIRFELGSVHTSESIIITNNTLPEYKISNLSYRVKILLKRLSRRKKRSISFLRL